MSGDDFKTSQQIIVDAEKDASGAYKGYIPVAAMPIAPSNEFESAEGLRKAIQKFEKNLNKPNLA